MPPELDLAGLAAEIADRSILPGALLVDERQLVQCVRMSRSWIWRKISKGDFPAPLKMGGRSLWRRADIENWVEAQGAK